MVNSAGLFGFLWSFIVPYGLWAHPGHVGVIEVYYDPQTQKVAVTQRHAAADVKRALRQYTEHENTPHSTGQLTVLHAYYSRHLRLVINGKEIALSHTGDEEKEGELWYYAEASGVNAFDKVSITSTLLMDTFPSQIHIVHVRRDRHTHTLQLDAAKPAGEVHFEK